MDEGSSKAAKQAFYHGHSGAGKGELLALALCLPLAICVAEELKHHFGLTALRSHGRPGSQRLLLVFLLELVLVVLPQVALFMGALPPLHTCATLLTLAACSWAVHARARVTSSEQAASGQGQAEPQPAFSEQCSARPSADQLCSWVSSEAGARPAGLHDGAQAVLARAGDLAGGRRSWISCFRGGLMLYTIISILAVDFRAFPRRYAKTETYGTGLMDMGVGAMMVAGGLVSRATKEQLGGHSLLRDLASGIRAAAPCWVLWIARLVSLRAVDYHEHVGEYGVHWNFFASVAMVALLSHAVRVAPRHVPALALLVTCVHEALLTCCGLGPWGLSETRKIDSLLDMNKEGLVSVLGYWALHLWGAAFAAGSSASVQEPLCRVAADLRLDHCDPALQTLPSQGRGTAQSRNKGEDERTKGGSDLGVVGLDVPASKHQHRAGRGAAVSNDSDRGARDCGTIYSRGMGGEGEGVKRGQGSTAAEPLPRVGAVLAPVLVRIGGWAVADAALWALLRLAEACTQPVSRRLCNLTFIIWVCAFCGALALPLLVSQVLLPCGLQPWLPTAFNRNMLPLFLVANLATGMVNLGMDTLSASDHVARGVVSIYAGTVCGLAAYMDAQGIRINLKSLKTSWLLPGQKRQDGRKTT